MSTFIHNAKKYAGVKEGSKGFVDLVRYYNTKCTSLVPANRRYQMKLTDEWCAMFCSVIAHQTGIKDFPYEVSVYYMWQRAKQMGLVSQVPKENYLIIYDWENDGTLNHVGIVTKVTGDIINVIEGNYDRQVRYRTINKNSKLIHGYIIVKDVQTSDSNVGTDFNATIDKIARDVIAGKYGVGETRRQLLGANYNIVQQRVNHLLKQR